MKKILLLLSIGLLIISCSSDESETPDVIIPENQISENEIPDIQIPENQISNLTQTEQRVFEDGALTETIVTEYDDNKLTLSSFYDSDNQLTFTSEWSYDNNYVSSIKGYLPNGTLSSEQNITYDDSNRIIKTFFYCF